MNGEWRIANHVLKGKYMTVQLHGTNEERVYIRHSCSASQGWIGSSMRRAVASVCLSVCPCLAFGKGHGTKSWFADCIFACFSMSMCMSSIAKAAALHRVELGN